MRNNFSYKKLYLDSCHSSNKPERFTKGLSQCGRSDNFSVIFIDLLTTFIANHCFY